MWKYSRRDPRWREGARMKVLCVCLGGNCRSVHLAYLLKYRYGHDALACGVEPNGGETFALLCNWAEKIILLVDGNVPTADRHKVIDWTTLGPDQWFNPSMPLLTLLDEVYIKCEPMLTVTERRQP